MTIDLASIIEDPGGHAPAAPADRDEIATFMATHWPSWEAEVLRALDKGNLVLSRDDEGISAFCAFEVNRAGFLGPVAARPDLIGRGAGTPALLGALHELRARGRSSIGRLAFVKVLGELVRFAYRLRRSGRAGTRVGA